MSENKRTNSILGRTKNKAKVILERVGFHLLCVIGAVIFINGSKDIISAYLGMIWLYHYNFRIKENSTLFPAATSVAQLGLSLFGSLMPLPAAIFWAGTQSWLQRAILRKFKIGLDWSAAPFLLGGLYYQINDNIGYTIPWGLLAVTLSCGLLASVAARKLDEIRAIKAASAPALLPPEQRPYAAFYESTALLEQKSQTLPQYLGTHTLSITRSTRNILKCMQSDPQDIQPGSRFLERYLPAVHKVVDEYTRLECEGTGHKDIENVLGKTDELLERMARAFHQEHGNLLRNDAIELGAELNMLDKLLKMDGK